MISIFKKKTLTKNNEHPIKRLIRSTLLISILPIVTIAILLLYQNLSLYEASLTIVAVIFGSIFFALPYVKDLDTLNAYVEQLTLDKKIKAPNLSFLSNFRELSKSVHNLQYSWEKRKVQVEIALAESSILLDTLPGILLMLDEKLNIIRTNNNGINFFGEDIIGKNLKTALKYDNEKLPILIKRVIENGKERSLESNIEHLQGKAYYRIDIKKFPVYSSGGIAAIVAFYDITSAKRHKEMMKEFVANASHEMRTPLTSIIGFVEMLQSMENEDLDNRAKFLKIIEEQAKHMTKLTSDLLSLSKTELKEDTRPKDIINIGDSVRSAVRNSEPLAHKKNMKLILQEKNNIPAIIGDSSDITQVVVNLINNAIKYGKANSDIIINLYKEKEEGKKTRVKFSVQNQGEIIDAEEIPKLTQRFYRSDKIRSKNIPGAGLGLAIVKHILTRHKGHLTITSNEKDGNIFTVSIPIASEKKIQRMREVNK